MTRLRQFTLAFCAVLVFLVIVEAPGSAHAMQTLDDELVAAVKRDDLAGVTRLVAAGASPNARLPDIRAGSRAPSVPLVVAPHAKGDPPTSCSVLALAVYRDDERIVHELLTRGAAGVDEAPYVLRRYADFSKGVEPLLLLLIALGRGNVEIVRDLLDHGAHFVNIRAGTRMRCVRWSVCCWHSGRTYVSEGLMVRRHCTGPSTSLSTTLQKHFSNEG